jgi:hypothetical protein
MSTLKKHRLYIWYLIASILFFFSAMNDAYLERWPSFGHWLLSSLLFALAAVLNFRNMHKTKKTST